MKYEYQKENETVMLNADIPNMLKHQHLKCTICGQKYITKSILAFFDNDGTRVMCWECQQLNKQ